LLGSCVGLTGGELVGRMVVNWAEVGPSGCHLVGYLAGHHVGYLQGPCVTAITLWCADGGAEEPLDWARCSGNNGRPDVRGNHSILWRMGVGECGSAVGSNLWIRTQCLPSFQRTMMVVC
jgi:hypothetical protein